MKNQLKISLLVLSLFLFTVGAADNPSSGTVAIITKAVQDVTFKKDNNWSSAKVGVTLNTGDEVKTGNKSFALIKFNDNTVIRVRENSVLTIYADKKDKELVKTTHIDKGKVGFEVSKQQENEEFRFTTPTAVASIRGTGGYFVVLPDGSTLLVVTTGLVNVNATQGNQQSGSVGGGNAAFIGNDGNLEITELTEEQKNQSNTLNNPNIKRLTIKTNKGDIVIEYVD